MLWGLKKRGTANDTNKTHNTSILHEKTIIEQGNMMAEYAEQEWEIRTKGSANCR